MKTYHFTPQAEIPSLNMELFAHTSSSKKPHFELIPYHALVTLANRFELGIRNHGEKSWNALSPNQAGLEDKDWIRSRVAHTVHHAYQFLLKLEGIIPDDEDDDAAAIMWAGAMFSEAKRKAREAEERRKSYQAGDNEK